MKSIADMLHERSVRADEATRQWSQSAHRQIRRYFEGEIDLPQLRSSIGGYSSFRLVGVTSPQTEEWSLLMAALDLLIEDAQDGQRLQRLSHGWITSEEYLSTVYPPRKEREARHGW